jgi:hypothetical protein
MAQFEIQYSSLVCAILQTSNDLKLEPAALTFRLMRHADFPSIAVLDGSALQ